MPGYTKSGGDYVEYAICRDDLVKISPTVVINGVLAMNIYDSLFSSSGMLNEQIAKEVFSVLAGQDTALAILDPGGTFWATDDRFSEVFADQEHLRRLCERIDDGDDPIITQIDDFSVVAAQLATNQINCGYLIIILPGYNPETVLPEAGIFEKSFPQVSYPDQDHRPIPAMTQYLPAPNDCIFYGVSFPLFTDYGKTPEILTYLIVRDTNPGANLCAR